MWKCSSCNNKINYLQYSVPVSGEETGTATLSERNNENGGRITDHEYDNSDTSSDGDYHYSCPECGEDVAEEVLVWVGEEEEEEEKEIVPKKKVEVMEETTHAIIRPLDDIIESEPPKVTGSSLCCKKCRHIIIFSMDGECCYGDYFCECPKCNEVNSLVEYKELIKSGFYNKNPNDHTKHKK